jgi:hypothetical protein
MLEMVLGWVKNYGILGVGGIDSPAYRGKRRRGCRESVAAFATEVRRAALVLDAFEAISSDYPSEMVHNFFRRHVPELASWPLDEMKGMLAPNLATLINEYVEKECYPIFRRTLAQGTPDSLFSMHWGFKSLLGAMYLQMMFYTLEPGMLRWCKATDCNNIITFEKGTAPKSPRKGARGKYRTRADKEYCSSACAQRMRDRSKVARGS